MTNYGNGALRISLISGKAFWQFSGIQSHSPYRDVLEKPAGGMIGTKWFSGATVNYAEHIFRNKTPNTPAILFQSETSPLQSLSWAELEDSVSRVAAWLKSKGIVRGTGGITDAQYPGNCHCIPGNQQHRRCMEQLLA